VKKIHTKAFTNVKVEFPKLSINILKQKFGIADEVKLNSLDSSKNKNGVQKIYWTQLNQRMGFAHNRGAVATIDEHNKTATILYNNQSSSMTSFKLNEDTDADAGGLNRTLLANGYAITYVQTTKQDSEEMKLDLGLHTDINPMEQQCPNSCGTAAQRFILYNYFKDNNILHQLSKEQRKALSNDISFWQYVHGDCDTVEKFRRMSMDRNFEINSSGNRLQINATYAKLCSIQSHTLEKHRTLQLDSIQEKINIFKEIELLANKSEYNFNFLLSKIKSKQNLLINYDNHNFTILLSKNPDHKYIQIDGLHVPTKEDNGYIIKFQLNKQSLLEIGISKQVYEELRSSYLLETNNKHENSRL